MDNPFRRGKPAQHHRPLVASAARVKIGDRHEAERLKRYRQDWQHEALAYADAIGEIRYPLHFMAAQTTRIRVYPAILVDPDQPPLPLHEAADLPGANIPDDLITAAQLDLDTLGMGQIGLRPILSGTYLNSKTTGEMWLTGWTDSDGEEHWEIRSIDEVVIDDQAKVWLRDEPGVGAAGASDVLRPFPDDGYITRIWRPHYRWRALADSPMKSILDSSEELLLASRVVRSLLRNRIAGNGLAVLAQELSLPGVDSGDDDPEADPLFEALTTAMMTAIQDEGDASAAIPVMLRAPADLIDKAFKHFTLDRPLDEVAMKLRPELIGRIATGMDWPRELVTGISDMNHWSAWAVDESTFKGHIEPDVIVQCDELTVAYARPMLQARTVLGGVAQFDPALIKRIVYWYDPTELVTKPDQSANVQTAFEGGAVGRVSLRKHLGLSDDDKPDQLDDVLWTLGKLRGVDPHIAIPILSAMAPEIAWPDPDSIGSGGAVAITPAPTADGDPKAIEPGAPPEPDGHPVADAEPGTPKPAVIAAGVPEPTGAMVAFYPTAEQAQTLAMDGGETPESIHVTLAYLGTASDLTAEQTAALEQIVTSTASQWSPLNGEFGGIGRFTAGDSPDGDPIIATVDVPGLGSLRDQLCQHLAAAGVPLPSEHGFTPHATLAYVEADAEMPAHRLDPVPATFAAISVCLAGERTDYNLTGTGEPLVAAVSPVSSQRLLDIDRQLRAKLLTACDAAVRRVLERAGARLRSKTAKDPALRAQVASVTNPLLAAVLGPAGVDALGMTPDDLTTEDWADLRRQWDAWVHRAQAQTRRHAARLVNIPDSDPSIAALEEAHAAGAETGWSTLATGLTRLVAARLFDPHPDAPPLGEFDPELTVPPGLIRQAMATAGGGAEITVDGTSLPAGAWGVGQGSAVQRFLTDNGMTKRSYTWQHGGSDRPLEAHENLDGYEFTAWNDPGLENTDTFPEVEVLAPGDHDGCSCDAWITWETAAADEAVAAAAGIV